MAPFLPPLLALSLFHAPTLHHLTFLLVTSSFRHRDSLVLHVETACSGARERRGGGSGSLWHDPSAYDSCLRSLQSMVDSTFGGTCDVWVNAPAVIHGNARIGSFEVKLLWQRGGQWGFVDVWSKLQCLGFPPVAALVDGLLGVLLSPTLLGGGQREANVRVGLTPPAPTRGDIVKESADDKVDERLLRMLAKNFESRDGGGEQWGPVRGEDDDGAEGVVIIDGRKRRQRKVRGRNGAWGGLFD